MSSIDDLLGDILPMVLFGILDPKYVTGKKDKPPPDPWARDDEKESDEEDR